MQISQIWTRGARQSGKTWSLELLVVVRHSFGHEMQNKVGNGSQEPPRHTVCKKRSPHHSSDTMIFQQLQNATNHSLTKIRGWLTQAVSVPHHLAVYHLHLKAAAVQRMHVHKHVGAYIFQIHLSTKQDFGSPINRLHDIAWTASCFAYCRHEFSRKEVNIE